MHIPDGYLSPATAGVFYGMMAPLWYWAGRKIRGVFLSKSIPLMALLSAFCFVIQMLNVPLPGGSTGHAVGASLAAILLSPWPALVCVSVALLVQALFFGDGGITTYAANCFNMAFVQVFLSYYIYSMIKSEKRNGWAAAIAAYVGTIVAGLMAGIELGLQPSLATGPDGAPLYAPYPLSVAVSAMLIGHVFAGLPEALLTAAAVVYVHRAAPELLQHPTASATGEKLRLWWLVLGIVILLTPLGLLAPGTSWGEWSAAQLRDRGLGSIPEGIARWEGFWSGVFSDYTVPGLGEKTGYIFSALLGVLLIVGVFHFVTLLLRKQRERERA